MDPAAKFQYAGIAFGVGVIVLGVLALVAPRKWPNLWKTLPRERVVGGIVGVICLIWTADMLRPLLEGGLARFQPMILPVCIVIGVASAFLIDYVLTRAFSALVLLVVNALLHLAFVIHAPARPVYALALYVMGVLAILLIAQPYRFRDLLERLSQSARWRLATGGSLLLIGVLTSIIPVLANA